MLAETMSKAPLTVCITGAAGQIGYALLPHICSGKTFGPDQPIKLHLLDLNIEGVQTALGGVRMELEDSTYPLLKGVVTTGDAKVNVISIVLSGVELTRLPFHVCGLVC
jgi:malate/lactate dehydrogenase